ncbi:MAG: hypothetical protein H0T68_04410 [Gemmatimonadales bacterium]|nr:hypothetical protein [Gemmatimonadales bacterium]
MSAPTACSSLIPNASASPPPPPIRPSTARSVSSWVVSRPRVAPSAALSAISRRRAAARASWRFAEFAQAMSSTNPTTPRSASTALRNWGSTIVSASDIMLTDHP